MFEWKCVEVGLGDFRLLRNLVEYFFCLVSKGQLLGLKNALQLVWAQGLRYKYSGASVSVTQVLRQLSQLLNRRAPEPLPALQDQVGFVGKIWQNKPTVLLDYTEQQRVTVTSLAWQTCGRSVGNETCSDRPLVGDRFHTGQCRIVALNQMVEFHWIMFPDWNQTRNTSFPQRCCLAPCSDSCHLSTSRRPQ